MKNLKTKTVAGILSLLITKSIFAADLKYVCAETDKDNKVKVNGKTMLVTQLNSSQQTDGSSNPYLIELFSSNSDVAELKLKTMSEQEDVILDLKKDKQNHLRIYLDELNQVYLTVKGKESEFNCLPLHERAEEAFSIQGVIADVITAEMDPFVVGDACVVTIKTKEGHQIGLLSDFEACTDATEDLFVGREITVALTDKERLRSSSKLQVLRDLLAVKAFYEVDFGTIENGLADLK